MGGWIIIAGWRSSGFRPRPSGGTIAALTLSNGLSQPTIRTRKKAATTPSTAVAQGVISRSELRVRNRTALENSDSSRTHSSSDPSWVDHMPVTL